MRRPAQCVFTHRRVTVPSGNLVARPPPGSTWPGEAAPSQDTQDRTLDHRRRRDEKEKEKKRNKTQNSKTNPRNHNEEQEPISRLEWHWLFVRAFAIQVERQCMKFGSRPKRARRPTRAYSGVGPRGSREWLCGVSAAYRAKRLPESCFPPRQD